MIELPLGVKVAYPDTYQARRYMERRGFVRFGARDGECLARRDLASVGPAALPEEPIPTPFRVRIIKS